MKAILALALLVPALPALAQDAATLDLTLPKGSLYAQDPPGKYYGDTSGRTSAALAAPVARNACGTPLDQDDGKAKVSGSLATGIGYTEGRGNSHWNAATVNLCKSYTTDEGNSGAFNLNIGVSQYDGPGMPGTYYRRAPGDVGPPPPQGMRHRAPR